MISPSDSAKGQIFVQIWPVQTKRGNLNVVELLRCAPRQPGIVSNWELNLSPALHENQDVAAAKNR